MSLDRIFSDDGKQLTIFVDEKFDFSQVQNFRQAYSNETEQVISLTIDLSNTEYMDSSALGMLLQMQKSMQDHVKVFKIIHANPQVLKILQIARFGKKFELC